MHSSLTGALDMSVVWKIVVLEMIGSRMEFGIASDILGHSYTPLMQDHNGERNLCWLVQRTISAVTDTR